MKNVHRNNLAYKCLGIVLALVSLSMSAQAQVDFGKSYINVTKGINGGTVEPGDTLEIRACFVVRSGSYDSCGYFDAVPAGTAYIPNTLNVLTNEGKIYKHFTDVSGDDAGWITGSNVRINLGYNGASTLATATRRGTVANTDKPSFYTSTCIMIASFRVKVTAALGSILSTGAGSITYKTAGVLKTFTYPANSVAVYPNYGMCANAIGTNALGTEFNGTFGFGKPRNRGTSANVPPSYTYDVFTANGPNDYFYGIANNTSTINGYTTSNAWAIPDKSVITHRVFQVWDIIGDHTGAASPSAGNPAADTVANPKAGYMLVVNASYRIDSAFAQTISNLCPNTYYEISCWMRNICSKCGCDVNGIGASSGNNTYIPTAAGDSSGVYPNLTFDVDGVDYYTTGNIHYTGTWVKKGFVFLTGPGQTNFTLKFFNNAPGGGGNDWALDDISVATCGPNLAFTPTNQPTVCEGNVVDIGAYVRSYFNNYANFKWQKSINNGLTWADAGASGTGSPVWNGSAYQYFTPYPTFVATAADSGTKFRVVVATTPTNLSNANCSFADVTSVLTLNVLNCGNPLAVDFLSFTGSIRNGQSDLHWAVSDEVEPVQYIVEKSIDGVIFGQVAIVQGRGGSSTLNAYNWSEPFTEMVYYRIRIKGATREKISRIVRLWTNAPALSFTSAPNPFSGNITARIDVQEAQVVSLYLLNDLGQAINRRQYTLSAGQNTVEIRQLESLPSGLYTLQVRTGETVVNRKLVKR
jgi:hypothetical protein